MCKKSLLLLFLLPFQLVFAQTSLLTDFPEGYTPKEVGKRLAYHFVDGKHMLHIGKWHICHNRRNIVLSSNPATECPGAEVFPSLEAALQSCKEEEHIYIIGGASIYQQALSFADELCLTEIDDMTPEADAYFPEVSPEMWQEKSREAHPADEKHLCSYAFVDYVRK